LPENWERNHSGICSQDARLFEKAGHLYFAYRILAVPEQTVGSSPPDVDSAVEN